MKTRSEAKACRWIDRTGYEIWRFLYGMLRTTRGVTKEVTKQLANWHQPISIIATIPTLHPCHVLASTSMEDTWRELSRPAQQAGFPKAWYGARMKQDTGTMKSEDQVTNTAPRWRWNWIQASFIILVAVNERICGELSYNSCGLQGQRTKWSLSIE